MARTKETKMSPEQQEKMTQEVMASLQPSTYGKDYAQKHSSFFEEVENSDLEVVTENVAATTSNMEDELTNEVQSPPNPQKRISGKQRKATLEEYQQTFLQVPRIDDRKPVFVSSDVRDRLDQWREHQDWEEADLKYRALKMVLPSDDPNIRYIEKHFNVQRDEDVIYKLRTRVDIYEDFVRHSYEMYNLALYKDSIANHLQRESKIIRRIYNFPK